MSDLGAIAQNGLVSKQSPNQSVVWLNSGAWNGLLVYGKPLQSVVWSNTGAYQGLPTYGRTLQAPAWANTGADKGLLSYGSTPSELEATIPGSTTLTSDLALEPKPGPPPMPPLPPILAPSTMIPCEHVLKQCLPCDDDPIANFSAEGADSDDFQFTFRAHEVPPLGFSVVDTDAPGFCTSTVSQIAAEDCARQRADQQINDTTHAPNGQKATVFLNTPQSCTVRCSDGSPFTYTLPAGMVAGFTQGDANRSAFGLACEYARRERICFITQSIDGGCVNQAYSKSLRATGGTPFLVSFFNIGLLPDECFSEVNIGDRFPYIWWLMSGALPDGLTLHPCRGVIDGTPTMVGEFSFTLRVTDANGSYQEKTFNMSIVRIDPTADTLPDAFVGSDYIQNLSMDPPHDQETEHWSVTDGDLPPGLELTEAGVLHGTPTGSPAGYAFSVQGNALFGPNNQSVQCTKDYRLTVNPSTVTPDINNGNDGTEVGVISYWSDNLAPGNYRISYVNGAMRYGAGPTWNLNHISFSRGFYIIYNNGTGLIEFNGTTASFVDQAAVEAANAGRFSDITHTGGSIGMYLKDSPYGDNINGSPDPTFRLSKL